MNQQGKKERKTQSCFNSHVLERPVETFVQTQGLATDKATKKKKKT
jgi:hypothetical protein